MHVKIIIAIVSILLIGLLVGLLFMKEKYSNQQYQVKLIILPSLQETASLLDFTKLSQYIQTINPDLMFTGVENVSSKNSFIINPPFQAAIVVYVTESLMQRWIPIASSAWYKTDMLNVEQLEDAIYNNARIRNELQKSSLGL